MELLDSMNFSAMFSDQATCESSVGIVQMEDVTEMLPYDTAGVRNQLKELDGRKSEMPPDVKMLRKDQTLLDKVKNLITRYIEVQGKKRQDVEPPEADDEFREKTPALFEVSHPNTF